MHPILLVALVLSACATTETAAPRSSLDGVPPAVATTIRSQAGTAEVAVRRQADATYEASWWEDGLEREATIAADGKLVELESEVRANEVPPAVRAAATQALAGAATIKYVRLMGDRYEAEAIVDGKERELVLTAAGQPTPGDDDEADDDDGD